MLEHTLVLTMNEMTTTTYTVVLGKFVKLNAEHSCPIVYMCRVMIQLTAIVTKYYVFKGRNLM